MRCIALLALSALAGCLHDGLGIPEDLSVSIDAAVPVDLAGPPDLAVHYCARGESCYGRLVLDGYREAPRCICPPSTYCALDGTCPFTHCGDGVKDASESCVSCPADAVCPAGTYCDTATEACRADPMDGVCRGDLDEQCDSPDCPCLAGSCDPVRERWECIGDGVCTGYEDCNNSVDCPCSGACRRADSSDRYVCDDGVCASYENCGLTSECTCASGSCVGIDPIKSCSDGLCGPGENCRNSVDCACPAGSECTGPDWYARCSDGICGTAEDCSNSVDCPCAGECKMGVCSDGVCSATETCHNSPKDCACPAGTTCTDHLSDGTYCH